MPLTNLSVAEEALSLSPEDRAALADLGEQMVNGCPAVSPCGGAGEWGLSGLVDPTD